MLSLHRYLNVHPPSQDLLTLLKRLGRESSLAIVESANNLMMKTIGLPFINEDILF